MSDHRIKLHGPAATPISLSGHVFRDLLDVLVEGSERSLRFQVEGISVGGRGLSAPLSSAADFSLRRASELPANELQVETVPLFRALPDRFAQRDMFDDVVPQMSAFDLFEKALEDALSGNEESDRFDSGLLKTLSGFQRIFRRGVDRVEFINGRRMEVNRQGLDAIEGLRRNPYRPAAARIAGLLDAIKYSDCRFTLQLADGSKLSGTAVELGQARLKAMFGKNVVVTGMVDFSSSGKPLRIQAEDLAEAKRHDASVFGRLPKPLLAPTDLRTLRATPTKHGGLEAIVGKWPGDETDEEIWQAFEDLS